MSYGLWQGSVHRVFYSVQVCHWASTLPERCIDPGVLFQGVQHIREWCLSFFGAIIGSYV